MKPFSVSEVEVNWSVKKTLFISCVRRLTICDFDKAISNRNYWNDTNDERKHDRHRNCHSGFIKTFNANSKVEFHVIIFVSIDSNSNSFNTQFHTIIYIIQEFKKYIEYSDSDSSRLKLLKIEGRLLFKDEQKKIQDDGRQRKKKLECYKWIPFLSTSLTSNQLISIGSMYNCYQYSTVSEVDFWCSATNFQRCCRGDLKSKCAMIGDIFFVVRSLHMWEFVWRCVHGALFNEYETK